MPPLLLFDTAENLVSCFLLLASFASRIPPLTALRPCLVVRGGLYEAVAVGIEQLLEVGYLSLQLAAGVGVGYEHTVGRHLHYLRGALDVGAAQYGVLSAGEGLMLHKLESAAVVHEGVAGYAGLLVVGLREASVYHHEAALGLDGVLAAGGVHGHVAVDDVAVGAGNAEGVEYAVAYARVVAQGEVAALVLAVCVLVGEEVSLECCHLRLVEEHGVGSAPEVEEVVGGVGALAGVGVGLEGAADDAVDAVH